MMRILHLVLAPRLSGAQVLVKDLALHQHREGHVVCVTSLLPGHDDFATMRAELERNRVTLRFPQQQHRLTGKLWHLFRVIQRFETDVIFAHATIPALYVRALPVFAPIVYVMHSRVNDLKRPLFRWGERLLGWRAKAVIGVSQTNVDDYVAAVGGHRVMAVIPNGVNIARFSVRAGAKHPRRSACIVQIGRYSAIKNQLQTVRAFREVLVRVPTARLSLYGVVEDPAYYQAVVDLADELGVADCVAINGPTSNIPQILSDFDVFVMPSLAESHGVAFIEALASGIPVVANAIAPFAFAKGFAAVQLIDTDDTTAYARALSEALQQGRAQRQLDGLALADTAARYIALARKLVYRQAA
jgi:L-malate glycosyltransferase